MPGFRQALGTVPSCVAVGGPLETLGEVPSFRGPCTDLLCGRMPEFPRAGTNATEREFEKPRNDVWSLPGAGRSESRWEYTGIGGTGNGRMRRVSVARAGVSDCPRPVKRLSCRRYEDHADSIVWRAHWQPERPLRQGNLRSADRGCDPPPFRECKCGRLHSRPTLDARQGTW